MTQNKSQSITKKLKDLVTVLLVQEPQAQESFSDPSLNTYPTRRLGNVLVALSGLILYLDKALGFFSIEFSIPQKFVEIDWDFNTFIWFMCQTFSPLLLCLGALFKAHKFYYTIPLYFYSLQLYYVLFDFKIIDDGYYIIYAFASTLLVLLVVFAVNKFSQYKLQKSIQKEKERLRNELSKN